MFYTYIHYRADDGKPFYVGKGHGRRAYSRDHRNRHWHFTVAKHGYNVVLVDHWGTEEEAYSHERFLIASFRALGANLVNMTEGGEGQSKGWIAPPEMRAKLSAAHKGRKRSPETRMKHAETMRRYYNDMSDQDRIARSEKIKETMMQPEIRAEISRRVQKALEDPRLRAFQVERLTKLHATPEMRARTQEKIRARMCDPILCVETGQEFATQGEAAEWLREQGNPKAHQVTISRVVTGKAKSAYGYHWQKKL